jgi:hypothetical protein
MGVEPFGIASNVGLECVESMTQQEDGAFETVFALKPSIQSP